MFTGQTDAIFITFMNTQLALVAQIDVDLE